MRTSLEQMARDVLEAHGIEGAQSLSAGDLVAAANAIGDCVSERSSQYEYISEGWPSSLMSEQKKHGAYPGGGHTIEQVGKYATDKSRETGLRLVSLVRNSGDFILLWERAVGL